jgi:hypothetical protein
MDEDHVNRRDAVVGLGLLGVLTLLFVATIFYRIINPSPPDRVSLDGMTIASDPLESAAPLASQPPALPEMAPVLQDSAVSAAAFGSEPPTKVDQPQPVPTFVSPSSVPVGTP